MGVRGLVGVSAPSSFRYHTQMKDILLNFSFDKIFNLPPTEFLSLVVLVVGLLYGIYKVLDSLNG